MLMAALVALNPQETMFEPSAAQVRLELITHEPGQHGIALTKMREECVGVLLDHLVEQSLLGPVARVAPLRGDEGGKSVRLRGRLDGEHPPDWSAPMSGAQWLMGASRYRLCPCPCERRSRKVGRSASTRRCHSSMSRALCGSAALRVSEQVLEKAMRIAAHLPAADSWIIQPMALRELQLSSTIS